MPDHDGPKYSWDTEEMHAKLCDQERAERAKRTKRTRRKIIAFVVAGIGVSLLVWANTPTPEQAGRTAKDGEAMADAYQTCVRIYGDDNDRSKDLASCQRICLGSNEPTNRLVSCINACGRRNDAFGDCIGRAALNLLYNH